MPNYYICVLKLNNLRQSKVVKMKVYIVTYQDAYTRSEHIISADNADKALNYAITQETGYTLQGQPVKPDMLGFKVYEVEGIYAKSEGVKEKKQVY